MGEWGCGCRKNNAEEPGRRERAGGQRKGCLSASVGPYPRCTAEGLAVPPGHISSPQAAKVHPPPAAPAHPVLS